MKRLFYLVFLLIVFSDKATASHIVGAQLYYDYLGGNSYKITLVAYRNCTDTCYNCAPYDAVAYIHLFDTAGNYVDSISMLLPPRDTLAIADSAHCWPILDFCVEVVRFQQTVTLPYIPGGYTLVYERCCRNSAISNIANNTGAAYFTTIADSLQLSAANSRPRFKQINPQISLIDTPFFCDISAIDPDGDSLVYSLINAFDYTNSAINVRPTPLSASSPPFISIPFIAPYSVNNPTNNPPDSNYLRIDSKTGILSGQVNQSGTFLLAVAAMEYRNGMYLGSTIIDFQFTFTACQTPNQIKEVESTDGIKIYSNRNEVVVEFANTSEQVKISFYNLLGQEISEEEHNSNSIYTKQFDASTPQNIIAKVQLSDGSVVYKRLMIE